MLFLVTGYATPLSLWNIPVLTGTEYRKFFLTAADASRQRDLSTKLRGMWTTSKSHQLPAGPLTYPCCCQWSVLFQINIL